MTASGPPLEVVIGVVLSGDGRFLVQPRAGDPAMAGLWEWPGGKVRAGEPRREALAREVEEETGLAVRVGEEPLCATCHAYADRRVALWAYACAVVGSPRAPDRGRWVTPEEYRAMPSPAANAAILAAIERWPPAAP